MLKLKAALTDSGRHNGSITIGGVIPAGHYDALTATGAAAIV